MRTAMTAALLTAHGGPEALTVRNDVPKPRVNSGQVLVEVSAAAVNNTDIWTRQGAYGTPGDPRAVAGWRGTPLAFPRIQGGDISGRVVETGDNVDPARIGERVMVDPALYDSDRDDANPVGLLGSELDGGFAQYVAVGAARAHEVQGSPLTDEQLACLPIAYGTAMGMLERAEVTTGERLLVTGASGGVGLALVQLAVARGARVIALTSETKQRAVREAGAHHTVSRSRPDLAAAVADAAGGPFHAIADVVGGDVLTSVFPLLDEGGRLVTAGAIAGPVVPFDLRVLYLRQRRLIGSSMHTPAHFRKLVMLAREGSLSPVVASRYSLDAIADAQRDFLAKNYTGKLVLRP